MDGGEKDDDEPPEDLEGNAENTLFGKKRLRADGENGEAPKPKKPKRPERPNEDPAAVAVRTTGKRWYDFVTSICAIVGGTFTTVGLIDAVAHKVLKAGKQL